MNKKHLLVGLSVIVLSIFVISGYLYFTNDNVEILQSTTPLTFGAKSESLVPAFAYEDAGASVEVIGSDFKIECDKTLYSGLTSITVLCDVTNLQNVVVHNKDVGMLFSPSLASISKVYLWDENVITGTYCSKYITKQNCKTIISNTTGEETQECYDYQECSEYSNTYGGYEETNKLGNDVRGLTFGKSETKQFKFIIKVPMGSTGKFDVLAGDTILDPWWDTTYDYRTPIENNYTTDWITTNITLGDIYWTRINNDSYVYSTGTGMTGTIAFGNETDGNCYEKETTSAGSVGSCIDDVYPSGNTVYHFSEGAGTQVNSSLTLGNGYNATFKGAGEPAWTTAGLQRETGCI